MPIDWILIAFGDEKRYAGVRAPKVLRLLRLSRFFKVARLLRLGKLRALVDFEEEYMGSSREGKRMVMFGIGRILVLTWLIGHVSGCFWYLVSTTFQDHYGTSWLMEKMPDYDVDDWFQQSTKYMWSFHYALATISTVGYGDMVPHTTGGKVIAGMTAVVGVIVVAVGIAQALAMVVVVAASGAEPC